LQNRATGLANVKMFDMNLIDQLNSRRSTQSRTLQGPGPDAEQLKQILSTAVRVPDHGKLVPWRFIRITGETRQHLGELLAKRSLERDPQAATAAIEKDRARFSFAPLIITVVATLTPKHKVPEIEQLMSGGAVCFALLQAAQGLGFGAQWLTGWAAYDEVILNVLGIAENERILGFIHIGNITEIAPERLRPDAMSLLSDLSL
jgi:nitroreductase